ncbi:MAG: hypothetical protein ACRC6X_07845 [Culicoidibacterales bacterium]
MESMVGHMVHNIYKEVIAEASLLSLIVFVLMMKFSVRIILGVIIIDAILENIKHKYSRIFALLSLILPLGYYISNVSGIVKYSSIDMIFSFIPPITLLIVNIVRLSYNKIIKEKRGVAE